MWEITKNLLEIFEKSVVKLNGWGYIPGSHYKMLYLNPYVYKGKAVILNDGTEINDGDLIGEIHIDNIKVKTVNTDYNNMMKIFFNELYALKNTLLEGQYPQLKAIYAMTALYPLIKRRGFTVVEADYNAKNRFVTHWEHILRVAFRQKQFKDRKRIRESKQIWFSRGQILKLELQ